MMLSLLEAHPVSGARIHDLRIAATMLENGVSKVATYDTHVFAHLPMIEPLDPSALIQARNTP
jgi:predicted nucleic acid-binding protein